MKGYKWIKEHKWMCVLYFVAFVTSMLYISFGAVSMWEVLLKPDIEPWRFWTALGAFICFAFLVIAGIIGVIFGFVRIILNKNKNQSSLVEN